MHVIHAMSARSLWALAIFLILQGWGASGAMAATIPQPPADTNHADERLTVIGNGALSVMEIAGMSPRLLGKTPAWGNAHVDLLKLGTRGRIFGRTSGGRISANSASSLFSSPSPQPSRRIRRRVLETGTFFASSKSVPRRARSVEKRDDIR
jgi:hypothetical protein